MDLMPSLPQEMETHGEKPSGDSYHANGQSDSEVWPEPVTEPAEPRRPRLSFSDTYVEIQCVPHTDTHHCILTIISHYQITVDTLAMVKLYCDDVLSPSEVCLQHEL